MTITQELLDRLVDEELTPTERGRVLEELALEPDGWQRLAESFLTAQAIASACRATVASTSTSAPLSLLPSTGTNTFTAPAGTLHSKWKGRLVASVAVSLAFAFGLWLGQDRGEQPTTGAELTQMGQANPDPPEPPTRQYAVVLGDPQTGFTTVSVPVYDSAEDVPDEWNQVPSTVRLLQQALGGPGRKLAEREDWVPVVLADGQTGMMPIREWSIRPTSLAEYP